MSDRWATVRRVAHSTTVCDLRRTTGSRLAASWCSSRIAEESGDRAPTSWTLSVARSEDGGDDNVGPKPMARASRDHRVQIDGQRVLDTRPGVTGEWLSNRTSVVRRLCVSGVVWTLSRCRVQQIGDDVHHPVDLSGPRNALDRASPSSSTRTVIDQTRAPSGNGVLTR